MEANLQIGKDWIKNWNERNLEGIISLYHEDIQHYSPKLKARRPETEGKIVGKIALREWFQDVFNRIKSLTFELHDFTTNEKRVIIEYTRKSNCDPDMEVCEVLDIKEGKILFSRVYHG